MCAKITQTLVFDLVGTLMQGRVVLLEIVLTLALTLTLRLRLNNSMDSRALTMCRLTLSGHQASHMSTELRNKKETGAGEHWRASFI